MQEDKKRIDPKIFQAIQLDEVAQGIRELIKLTKTTIPEGNIWVYDDIEITSSTKEIRLPYGQALFSITIYNKGPALVYAAVNTGHGGEVKVESGDSLPIDFGAAKIRFIKLWCDSGQTTTVKIVGTN